MKKEMIGRLRCDMLLQSMGTINTWVSKKIKAWEQFISSKPQCQ